MPSDDQNEISAMCRREFLQTTGGLLFTATVTSLAFTVSGCGGSGNQLAGAKLNGKKTGRVQLKIDWPPRSKSTMRYIPPYAVSLVFELYAQANPSQRYTLVANRPDDTSSTQTITFSSLIPVGVYTLAGVARVEANGQGGTVASAATVVTVKVGETSSVDLTLASTIKSIQILGQPLRLLVNNSLSLSGQALDPDGKIVVVPTGGLQWKILSGDGFISIAPDGTLKAIAVGTAQIQLIEPGAGIVSDSALVEVAVERNPNLVWVNSDSEIGYLNVLQGDYTRVGTVQDGNQSYTLNDIAWSSGTSPQLYGISSDNVLLQIDSTTAKATRVDIVKENGNYVETLTGLTFRSDGRLYAGGANQGLYTINPSTGEAHKIGNMPAASAGDIAFSPDDQLYLAANPSGIWRISPDTATGVQVSDSGGNIFYGIAFTGGKLYGFSTGYLGDYYGIVQIDTTTGTTTTIRTQPSSLNRISGASNAPR